MRNAYKIAGLGLLLSTAVTLAAAPASARGPMDGQFGGVQGFGERGGFFTSTFADLDVSGDGQITEEDLVSGAEARFAEVDTDGNGVLSAEELTASVKARIEERIAARTAEMGDTANRRAPSAEQLDTMAARMAARMIDARDGDDDGAVSLAELTPTTGFGRMIDRFDTDDDNAISEAEFDAAKQEIADRFAARDERGGRDGWGERGGKGGHGHGSHGGRR